MEGPEGASSDRARGGRGREWAPTQEGGRRSGQACGGRGHAEAGSAVPGPRGLQVAEGAPEPVPRVKLMSIHRGAGAG